MSDSKAGAGIGAMSLSFGDESAIAAVFAEAAVRFCGRCIGAYLEQQRQDAWRETQVEAAQRIGLTGTAWSKWVNEGITSLRRLVLAMLAWKFDVPECFPTRAAVLNAAFLASMVYVRERSTKTAKPALTPDEFACLHEVMSDLRAWHLCRTAEARLEKADAAIASLRQRLGRTLAVTPARLLELVPAWQGAWAAVLAAVTIQT